MPVITRAEVKQLLDIQDKAIVAEPAVLTARKYARMAVVNRNGDYTISRVAVSEDRGDTVEVYTTSDDYYSTQDFDGALMIRRSSSTGNDITTGATVYVDYLVGEYDSIIDTLIPILEEDLSAYLNHYFHDPNVQYDAGDLTFDDTAKTITDANAKFIEKGFVTGMDIRLDSPHPRASNVGIYNNVTVAAGTITVASTYDLVEFDDGWSYRVSRINWPRALKPVLASIIWHNVNRLRDLGVDTKSRGGMSKGYLALKSGGYPAGIYAALARYRRPVFA